MFYALSILCSGSLLISGLLFYKRSLHDPVELYLVPVRIVCSSLLINTFVYVKTAFNPVSHIFPMEINGLCVIRDMIWTSLDVSASCGKVNAHYLVDIILSI